MKSSKFPSGSITILFLFLGIAIAPFYSKELLRKTVIAETENTHLENGTEKAKFNGSEFCTIRFDEFDIAMCRLNSFRERGSLGELIATFDEIESRFETIEKPKQGLVIIEFLSILTSPRLESDDDQKLRLGHNFAVRFLSKIDYFDLETEWRILRYSRLPNQASQLSNEQEQDRAELARLWFRLVDRFMREKDDKFDVNAPPPLKVLPPSKVPARFAGMTPQAIEDPRLRAEYETAIKENAISRENYNKQYRLRQYENLIMNDAVKYVSILYSVSPQNPQQLRQFFREFSGAKHLQGKIDDQIELITRDF